MKSAILTVRLPLTTENRKVIKQERERTMKRKKQRNTMCLIGLAVLLIVCHHLLRKNSAAWRWGQSQRDSITRQMNRVGHQISSISKSSLERNRREISPLDLSIQNGLEKSRLVNNELREKKSRMSGYVYGKLFAQWRRNNDRMKENKRRVAKLLQLVRTSVAGEDNSSAQKKVAERNTGVDRQ